MPPTPDPDTIPIPPPPSGPLGAKAPPPVPPTTPRHTRRTKSGPGTPAPRAFKAPGRKKERGDTAARPQVEETQGGSGSGSGSGTAMIRPTDDPGLGERQVSSRVKRQSQEEAVEDVQVRRNRSHTPSMTLPTPPPSPVLYPVSASSPIRTPNTKTNTSSSATTVPIAEAHRQREGSSRDVVSGVIAELLRPLAQYSGESLDVKSLLQLAKAAGYAARDRDVPLEALLVQASLQLPDLSKIGSPASPSTAPAVAGTHVEGGVTSPLRPLLLPRIRDTPSPSRRILLDRVSHLQVSVSSLETQHSALLSSHTKLRTAHESNLSSRKRAIAQLHVSQTESDTRRREVDDLRLEQLALKDELGRAGEEVEGLREKVRGMKRDIDGCRRREESAREVARGLMDENGRLREMILEAMERDDRDRAKVGREPKGR